MSYVCQTIPKKEHEPRTNREPRNWKPRHDLVFVNNRAEGLLRIIQPYIIGKKEQVRVALEYIKLKRRGGARILPELKEQRIKLAQELKQLTKRGLS